MYQYKDHLGNIRLSYSDSNNDGSVNASEILEENNYYPFGLKHKGYNNVVNGVQNNFLTYNGKEFDNSLNLNTFDLGARQMDPAIGRFMTIDPMADFVNSQSPYAMADNNPIANVDEYGLGSGIGDFLRKIFGGKKCSCGGGGSLGRRAKRSSSSRKRRRSRIVKANKPATPSGLARRSKRNVPLDGPKLEGLANVGSAEINASFDLRSPITIKTPSAPVTKPLVRNRLIDEVEENIGAPIIDINFNIPFKPNTTHLQDEAGAIKILSDLIKTLKDYPRMKIIVEGTLGARNLPGTPNLQTRVQVNGGNGPTEWLAGGRANAIIKILKDQGVDAGQLIKGRGIIGTTTNVVIKSKSN